VKEDAGFTRDTVVSHLEKNGIQTRMLFAGNLIKHPCFDEMRREGKGFRVVAGPQTVQPSNPLPVTDRIMNDAFWVGVYPGMTEEMLGFMVKTIKNFSK
jgi:CDP-6-deoxy-D-xylo-4-hexulose-3-dehydrase